MRGAREELNPFAPQTKPTQLDPSQSILPQDFFLLSQSPPTLQTSNNIQQSRDLRYTHFATPPFEPEPTTPTLQHHPSNQNLPQRASRAVSTFQIMSASDSALQELLQHSREQLTENKRLENATSSNSDLSKAVEPPSGSTSASDGQPHEAEANAATAKKISDLVGACKQQLFEAKIQSTNMFAGWTEFQGISVKEVKRYHQELEKVEPQLDSFKDSWQKKLGAPSHKPAQAEGDKAIKHLDTLKEDLNKGNQLRCTFFHGLRFTDYISSL